MAFSPVPPANHASDQPVDAIYKGLDGLAQSIVRLRSEIDDLQRLKNLATVHCQQNDSEIERLRQIYKLMKLRLETFTPFAPPGAISSPVRPAPPPQQQQQFSSVVRTEPAWDLICHDASVRQTGVRLRYALATQSILCAIRFNSDGSLFSFTDGQTVFFMRQTDGYMVGTCEMPRSPGQQGEQLSRALCFSPDSKFLAVAGPATSTTVIDVQSRKVVKSLEVHNNSVSTIAFFKDGRRLLTGGLDGRLCIWSVPEFILVRTIQHGMDTQEENMIAAIAIGLDDEYIAVGFMSGMIGLYEPTFSQPMSSFRAHSDFLLNVVISNKDVIGTASRDKTTKLWMIRGVPTCKKLLSGHRDCVLAIAFSPRDPVVFTGSKDETIKCWSQTSGENLFTLTGHRNTLFEIDHHPTERTIVSCSGEGLVCLWDYSLP
jgi:WD40 repeat protein